MSASIHDPATAQLNAQLKPLISDLTDHRAPVYWIDLLASMAVFWGAFALSFGSSVGRGLRLAAFVVAVLALYRAATFMHELAHLPQSRLPGFRWAWNLLCGIPLLLPSFLYYSHLNHHSTRLYATVGDPEYLAFGTHPQHSWRTLLIGALLSPLLLALRFAVLVPLAWLLPPLRRWLNVYFSAVAIHPRFQDRMPERTRRRKERCIAEPLTTLYLWLVVAACLVGWLPLSAVAAFAACAVCVLLVNAVRTRYAHRYAYNDESVSHTAQIEDSVTLDYGAWFALLAPVGLRFHALHHLFPHLPYHALATAHHRIVQSTLSAAEIYRRTCRSHSKPSVLVLSDER
ncbi:fatty acid desaturase family protein [Verminephrobacter eiseniae]|uniref:fatty acid desaturase family protein n=1 Tax=Verminephrobacter eiseniae TaxID=364317 RepID=UPI0022386B42|nr:fatty acid desaturase [Verminephrobacter eiseniae]MCW5231593.1 fatty acid desaturase [Verminephrobacter eiseniae]MCW5293322.1 fatty acid desaturase [Verminephrobacter eiseniae]MCW8187620.1 fatty acid desaturase [Verminephrobacter eiseniae]MCW8225931.1 fatty acid desaturase [Verminephrobacter eiseniae]MCW8236942.1 fatty acid desaturase [Verminephrobacter eiseniae]